MLQVNQIIAEKERFIEGLNKRKFPNAEATLSKAIELDELRKSSQQSLDANLAEANGIAKEIGALMKQGLHAEADKIKLRTSELKAQSKDLAEKKEEIEKELQALLYTIPNIPHTSVPFGSSEEDNEVVKLVGEMPVLPESALPHWELILNLELK
jgi:seryl-tRNA synthetase